MTISAVIFDFGNVIVRWQPAAALAPLYPHPEDAGRAMQRLAFASWNTAIVDAGEDIAASLAELARENAERHALCSAYIANIDAAHREAVPGTSALIEKLAAAGLRILGMTNTGEAAFAAMAARHPVIARMDDVFVSARERLMKPAPEAFERLLARNGLAPSECLFVDDSAANVAGARAVGIHAVLFTDAVALEAGLVRLGLLPGRSE